MKNNYRWGFDVWALALFLFLMIPTVLWILFPPLKDPLRAESVTPVVDIIGIIFQVLTVATLCFVQWNRRAYYYRIWAMAATILCILLYSPGWILYYMKGITLASMLLMTLPPCLAFVFYALAKRNTLAVIFAAVFTVCHLIYAIVNFLI